MARCPACMNSISRRDLIRTKGWTTLECKSCGERLRPHQWLFYLHVFLGVVAGVASRLVLEPHIGAPWGVLVSVAVMLAVIFLLVPLQKLDKAEFTH